MKKRMLSFLLAVVLILSCASCGKKDAASQDNASQDGTSQGGTALMSEEVTITNDVDASYFYDFANLIPFYQDIPYVAIKGDDMHPDLSYNWYSIVKTTTVGEYPYARLRTAYDYALSDIYAVNGRQEDEFEMAQYFKCTNSVNAYNGESMERDTWNEYDGLLWYLTFLNYRCDVETEEDEYGTLVHVKISNTDMIKLLYEELKNTYQMVQEDNRTEAEKRINNSFDRVKTYFKDEVENFNRLDHIEYTIERIGPGVYDVTALPVYGNSLMTKLNLAKLAGGLIYEGVKYQQNKAYWGSLSDDGTLYYYTLCQMILRMQAGDYDTVNSELTFYAEVDSEGNGYLPFDYRTNYTSFTQADEQWGGALADILASKGLASATCSMSNIQTGDNIFTWGSAADHDYENMVFWDIMGWRGSIAPGKSVTERPGKIGYTGLVEEVTSGAYEDIPVKLVEGKSVQADRDPVTGYYEVDGVLYDLSGGEAKAVGVVDGFSQTDLTLPKDINGCPVTTVGESALSDCESLKTLAIPEGVRVLEYNAVASCPNLLSVSLPTTLEEIGMGAFILCTEMREVNIPEGVTICEGAFLSCMSLEEVVIPVSVTELGPSAFDNCVSLHIWLPKTTKCGTYALRGVAEVSYGRPSADSGSVSQTAADAELDTYTVQLASLSDAVFGSGFYERYALRSRTSSSEYIGSGSIYRPAPPTLKFSYDEDGFLSVLDISYTLAKESAEGQLVFTYEKDANGNATAYGVSGNIYDVVLFDRNRDRSRPASGDLPYASDREWGSQVQNGLPFRAEGEPSAPGNLVGGLMSTRPLPEALKEVALKIYDAKADELAETGIFSPEEFQELLLGDGIPLDELIEALIAKSFDEGLFSAEEAQMLLETANNGGSDGNVDSSYSYDCIMSILGEEKEVVLLRNEWLSEIPGRYFWSGANWWSYSLTIRSNILPVGSTKNRECQMTVEEDRPGKPVSAYLTDGTDVFEYIFSYDSKGRITDISYYQYTKDRQRNADMERIHYTFTYDANGNLTEYELSYDGSISTATYTYDEQGRLKEQSYDGLSSNGLGRVSETQSYEYDDAGFVCRVTEVYNDSLTYVYEPLF